MTLQSYKSSFGGRAAPCRTKCRLFRNNILSEGVLSGRASLACLVWGNIVHHGVVIVGLTLTLLLIILLGAALGSQILRFISGGVGTLGSRSVTSSIFCSTQFTVVI